MSMDGSAILPGASSPPAPASLPPLALDPTVVDLVRNAEPKGFGANHNAAFALCDATWFGILNPDLALVDEEPFTPMLVREEQEGGEVSAEVLKEYSDPCSDRYANMIEEIRRIQNFTSLRYHRLDDLLESIGIDPSQVCTYCFDGRE